MLSSILIFLLHFSFFPQLSGWELLSSVDIVMGRDEFMDAEIEKPKFSKQLKLREGKELTLEGFIIPLQQEGDQDYFVLSRFPYQSCFFCGAAGPETVVEVYADETLGFTDERVRVHGILRLNEDNPLHLFYILESCEVVRLD